MGELCCCGGAYLGLVGTSDSKLSHGIWAPNVRLQQKLRRLPVVSAAASPGSRRKDKTKGRDSKSRPKPYTDEEIYNIKQGWKIRTDSSEKVIEIAGLQFPASLNKQKEKQEPPSEQAPRAVHKLLRVQTPGGSLSVLHVMGGKITGKKLLSPADMSVRPMMEVVRGAVFNMLQARGGYTGGLPPGRWLDLYSGTGSVGIEALSRGCSSAHFIELDPWVISNVLEPNLKATNFSEQAVVHMTRVETFLEDEAANPKAEVFDYISVTPPYELVQYPTLMEQLSKSPLVGEYTNVIVEYPLKSKNEMPETCGLLSKIVDRRYGRTHLAVYGPSKE